MLVIGTQPEYFQAVWVKNEWSRYLKMIKKDRSKMLIPCFRDMDAYDLPEEFAHLQAQDMAKLGFVNDLIRGIKKIIRKDQRKQETAAKDSGTPTTTSRVAPLVKRIRIFLEDGDWASADEYCEKALDMDPENGEVYMCKLMAELHIRRQEQLAEFPYPYDLRNNYQKAVRFAEPALKELLLGYVEQINSKIYNNAVELMAQNTEESYQSAAQLLEGVIRYKDAEKLIDDCKYGAKFVREDEIYMQAMDKLDIPPKKSLVYKIHAYKTAASILASIPEHKDADEQYHTCLKMVTDLTKKRKRKELLSALLTFVCFIGGIALFFGLMFLASHYLGLT